MKFKVTLGCKYEQKLPQNKKGLETKLGYDKQQYTNTSVFSWFCQTNCLKFYSNLQMRQQTDKKVKLNNDKN